MKEGFVRSDIELRPPVAIAVGAGFRREIATLAQMQNFLKEWPRATRGQLHGVAISACEAARAGRMEPEAARRAFLSFAAGAGIVWTGVDPVAALRDARIRRVRARREGQVQH